MEPTTDHVAVRQLPQSPLTALGERAIPIWPRLDRAQLRRAKGDPVRIGPLVSRRAKLPVEAIAAMLSRPPRATTP